MARALDVKKIKSAKRVLEIFEFFNAARHEATVMEIAREYGYPQSSTSELLGCLVELGFLTRDRYRRTYQPTAKVAMLGAWTHPRLFRRGHLLAMMDDLADELGCTVVLAGCVGMRVEHFETVEGGTPLAPAERPGVLTRGTLGRLLLSAQDRMVIRKLVHRINSEVEEDGRVRCEDLLVEVDTIRTQGFAASSELAAGQGGVVGVRLPRAAASEDLVIGVMVGAGDARGCGFFLRALRDAVAGLLDPIPALGHPARPQPVTPMLARVG